jgi:hypothetical protein
MNDWMKPRYLLMLLAISSQVWAQDVTRPESPLTDRVEQQSDDEGPSAILSPEEWRRLDAAVNRALAWLATQQLPDGSFPTLERGNPGVTSLCVLAYIAHGHNPDDSQYGPLLERAIKFILACQKPNGLVTLYGPEGSRITRDIEDTIGVTGAYNHAISSLTLSEVYGMKSDDLAPIQAAITKALAASLEMQRWPKDRTEDLGGWRYIVTNPESESDLSITGWQLMFLRSARNAGFNVPKRAIDDAVGYIRRCFDHEYGSFRYVIGNTEHGSRAMGGAGVLALAHAGFHNSLEAKRTGEWILQHSFDTYNGSKPPDSHDRYHYSLFNCCQGMYQLGSPYWEQFFPRTVRVVLDAQQPDGSWEAEQYSRDRQFGNAYSTALVILALGAPNQFLPVFQR